MDEIEDWIPGFLWILDEKHNPVCPESMEAWAAWTTEENTRVAYTVVGDCGVSTKFFGTEPMFETMVFYLDEDGNIFGGINEDLPGKRYRTWEAAVTGHQEYVAKLREILDAK